MLSNYEIVSEWGVKCRTPGCRGFAVLSRAVLKNRAPHPRPTERGVGECELCGCQYSVRLEEIEHRVRERQKRPVGADGSPV
jgi:hypothetical protein